MHLAVGYITLYVGCEFVIAFFTLVSPVSYVLDIGGNFVTAFVILTNSCFVQMLLLPRFLLQMRLLKVVCPMM